MVIQKLVNKNSRQYWWLQALIKEKELIIIMCFSCSKAHIHSHDKLTMVVELNLEWKQMDIKTMFLYEDLDT